MFKICLMFQKPHTNINNFLRFSFSTLNASSKCPGSFCFYVLFLLFVIPFNTSDISLPFSPLFTQVTNSCSSSLIVWSVCCLNPSVSFISWSIISICSLFLFCSFSDLFVCKYDSHFCRANWANSILEETLNSWNTYLLGIRWSFTLGRDVIVYVSICWFKRFLFRLDLLSTSASPWLFAKINLRISFLSSLGSDIFVRQLN